MRNVDRYKIDAEGYMIDSPNGQWVDYEDYAALQQKLDAMADENAALKSAFVEIVRAFDDASNGRGMERGEIANMYPVPLTPATDAYMNPVRAEGVQDYANDLRTAAIAAKENGHYMTYDYLSFESDRAEKYAQRLRSGNHDTADKAGAK